MSDLTPKQIVEQLDKYIIGQDKAKRAVAIALRNRYRRGLLDKEVRDEITPKNIIMVGPTGVGKTEIARRLAKLMNAPFVKVEATKFTEVGYVGRDVDSIVRDLVEAAVRIVKQSRYETVAEQADALALERLVTTLTPVMKKKPSGGAASPFLALLGQPQQSPEEQMSPDEKQELMSKREQLLYELRAGVHDNDIVEIEVTDSSNSGMQMAGIGIDLNVGEILGDIMPKKTKKRKVTVAEARKVLAAEEADGLIDMDEVISTAIDAAEQRGIVFIDELDKIAGKGNNGSGPDVSREGVQRDILPIVEGSIVMTKYGPVKTDYMLFIGAGAFHVAKISDLIPELQGRFPIKVELDNLYAKDFKRILTQPENAITKQYEALLGTEGVNIVFTDEALDSIAKAAQLMNETQENIGARRLHTIMENLLDDVSYNADGSAPGTTVTIDAAFVDDRLDDTLTERDLKKYIL